jgi:hypothetical protein
MGEYKTEKNIVQVCLALIEVLSTYLPVATEKNHKNALRTASALNKIQAKHLPNTSLALLRYQLHQSCTHKLTAISWSHSYNN